MGRVEILTGRDRRRTWTRDQKLAILDEVAAGNASIAEIARRHDVIPQQIYVWRRQLWGRPSEPTAGEDTATFLPVTMVPAAPAEPIAKDKPQAARPVRIEIRCKGGRVLKVEAGLDAEVLRGLIRSVESA